MRAWGVAWPASPPEGRGGGGSARAPRQVGGMRSAIGQVSVVFRFEFEGLAGQSESDPMSVRSSPIQ